MEMMFSQTGLVFVLTVIATFGVTILARNHSKGLSGEGIGKHKLNRWLVGLSAGATANSGFIVTAGVGLGYAYGMQWILLPIAWFLGDLVFWRYFPAKINSYGKKHNATTITDIITAGFEGKIVSTISFIVGILIIFCLLGYASAQWLAGQKFLSGAFSIDPLISLPMFAIVIVAYTAIGGFRGSVYADTFQAVLRLVGTFVVLVGVLWVAKDTGQAFWTNMDAQGGEFLNLFGMGSISSIIGFIIGFSAASLGFGLGQPQIITRYLAGANPQETKSAQWIYIGFVQFTWIAMTFFGVILKGIMPDIADPETGLSIFVTTHFGALLAGLIVADIFATIAATSNSVLIAMSQSVKNDLMPPIYKQSSSFPLWIITLFLGGLSMIVAANIGGTVLSLALSSVSYLAAGLAPAVMVKVLNLRSSAVSILVTILGGLFCAFAWKHFGYSQFINEAAPGIFFGLMTNWIVARFGTN